MIRTLIRTIRQHLRRPPAPLDATGPATLYGTGTYPGTITPWAIDPADRRDIW
ncbi:hypothetical protein ACFUYE_05445 [Micromonospora humida]|uniref:hypothetical protein n=1 Tax=Micromonospora humida TaxID=2809018 RepID=UPI003670FECA